MSGYTKFAVVGAGRVGNCIVQELLKEKAAGTVKEVAILTRQVRYPSNDQVVHGILGTSLTVDMKGSNKTVQGDVTYIPLSELDARLAADPEDIVADLHKLWATAGPFPRTDNHLYPDWNPSSVIDSMPLA